MASTGIIDNMSKEISNVLKKNLYALLNPIIEEREETNEALLNFPMIKNLKKKIQDLEQKYLENNCQKNIKIFELSQEIKEKNKTIENLENQLNKICSIKLEVKELKSSNEQVDIKSIKIMSEGKNQKIDKTPIKVTTNMFGLIHNSDEDDGEEYIYDEDEGEDEDEDEDEETQMIEPPPYLKGVLMAQKLKQEDAEEEDAEEEDAEEEDADEEDVEEEDADEEDAEEEDADEEDLEEEDAEEEDAEEEDAEEEDAEEEDAEEEDAEEEDDEEEDEIELEEIVINEIKYLTDSKINGNIYKCDDDYEIIYDEDDELITVGKYKNKKPELYI